MYVSVFDCYLFRMDRYNFVFQACLEGVWGNGPMIRQSLNVNTARHILWTQIFVSAVSILDTEDHLIKFFLEKLERLLKFWSG